MNILILGGTGVISRQVSVCLIRKGHFLVLANRQIKAVIQGAYNVKLDINENLALYRLTDQIKFDVVIDFLAFEADDVKIRYKIFRGHIKQYIFISTATVYGQKLKQLLVNESFPVGNRYSAYAQNKIKCEQFFLHKWDKERFPITIIRPSQTYNDQTVPLGIHGRYGSWQNILRIKEGKPVIIHEKGDSLWSATRSEDFAEWLSDILGEEKLLGEVLQLITDDSMTWKKIYSVVSDELGRRLNAIYLPSKVIIEYQRNYDFSESLLGDKSRSITFDNSKRKRYSQYNPQISMEEGIRKAVRGAINNSRNQIKDIEFDIWCDKMVFLWKKWCSI